MRSAGFFVLVAASVVVASSIPTSELRQTLHRAGRELFSNTRNKCLAAHLFSSSRTYEDHEHSYHGNPTNEMFILSEEDYDQKAWSYPPPCIRLVEPESKDEETYCVFNSNEFANGRGIAIFTTPEMATWFVANDAFLNPDSLVADKINEPVPVYTPKSMPTKGIGLVAIETLYRGDRLFSHTPVFIAHDGTASLVVEKRCYFQRLAVERLPSLTRKKFMELKGHFGGDEINDIIHTNSFQADMVPVKREMVGAIGRQEHMADCVAVSHSMVFPEISRLNHDCRPNAVYYFNVEKLAHYVFASRQINPGEELTISYIDETMLHHERKASLASWGFKCTCSACRQSAVQISTSDERMKITNKIITQMKDWSSNSTATPDMAELLISIYTLERLYSRMADAYYYASLEYNAVGDRINAIRMALYAYEGALLEHAPWGQVLQDMNEVLANAKTHWSWREREPRPMDRK